MNIPKTISRIQDQYVYCPEVNDAPQRCLPVMDLATFPQNISGNSHFSKSSRRNLPSKTVDSPQAHDDLGDTKISIIINTAEATNASDYPLKKIMTQVQHKIMKRQRSSDSCMPDEFRIMKPGAISEDNSPYTPITAKILNSEVQLKEESADNSQEDDAYEIRGTLQQSPFVWLQNRGTRLQVHRESITKLPFTKRNTCDVFMNLQGTKETKPVVLSQDTNQQKKINPCSNDSDTNTTNLYIKQNLRQRHSPQKCLDKGNICMQEDYDVDGQEGNQNIPFYHESCKEDEKGYVDPKRIIFREEKLVTEGGKKLQGQKTMPISCPNTFGINTQLPNIHDTKQNYGHNVRSQAAVQKNETGTICSEKLATIHPNRYINMSNLSVKILDFSDIVMKCHSARKMAMLWRNSNARKICHTLRRCEACQTNNDTCTTHESLPYVTCTANSDNKMMKSQDQLFNAPTEIYKESLHKRNNRCNDRKECPSRKNQRITVVRYEPFELAAISRSAKRRSINDLNPSAKKQLRHSSPGCSLHEAESDGINATESTETIYSDRMTIVSEPLDNDRQMLLVRSKDKTSNDLRYFVKDLVHLSDTGSSFSGSDIKTASRHVPPLDPIIAADTEHQRRKTLKKGQSFGNQKLLHDHLAPENGQNTARCHSADEFQSENFVHKESEQRSVSVGGSSGSSGIKSDIFKMWGICKVIKQWKNKVGTDKETKADAHDMTEDDSVGYQANKEVRDIVTSCPEKSEGEKASHEENNCSGDSGKDATTDQTPELTGENNASSNKRKQKFYTTSLLIYFLSKWRTRIRNEIDNTTGQGNSRPETATPSNLGKMISTRPKQAHERTWSSIKRDLTELILNSYLAVVENLNQEVLSLAATVLEETADARPKPLIIAISTLPLKGKKSSRLRKNEKQGEKRRNVANVQGDTVAVTSSERNPCLKADGETDTGESVTLKKNLSLTDDIQNEKDVGSTISQISTHYKPHEMHGKYPKQTKEQRKKSRDLLYFDTKPLYNRTMPLRDSCAADGDVDFINVRRRSSIPPIIQACNELPAHVLLNSRVCSAPEDQMKKIIDRKDTEEMSTVKRPSEQAPNNPNSIVSQRKKENTSAGISPNLPVKSPHKRLLLSNSPLEDDVFLSTPSSPASSVTIYTLNTFTDEKHDNDIDNYGPFYVPSLSNTQENWQSEDDHKSKQTEKVSDVEKHNIGEEAGLSGTDANNSTEKSGSPKESLTLNTICSSKNDVSNDERSDSQCIHEHVIKCITHSEDESRTQAVLDHQYIFANDGNDSDKSTISGKAKAYSEWSYKPISIEGKDAGINSSEGDVTTGARGKLSAPETKDDVGGVTEYNVARSKQQPSGKYKLVAHDIETQDIIGNSPYQPTAMSSDRIRHSDARTELLEEDKSFELSTKVSSLRFAEEDGLQASLSGPAVADESEDGAAAEKKLGNFRRSKNVKSPRSRPKSVEDSKTSDLRVRINNLSPGHLAVSPSVSSLRSEERRQEVKERRARAMEQIGPLPLLRSPLLRYKIRDDPDHDHITEDITWSPSSLLKKWKSFRGQTEQQDRPSVPSPVTNNDRRPSCLHIFACCSHYNDSDDEN